MKPIFRSPKSEGKGSPIGRMLHRAFGSDFRGARVPRITLLLYVGVLAFFGLFFVLPIAIAVRGAFLDQTGALTFDYVREVFRNPIYLEGFTNALRLAVGSTLLAFAIAAPLAWISERFEFPAKRALSAFLLLPMMLPPFVGAIGSPADLWPGRRRQCGAPRGWMARPESGDRLARRRARVGHHCFKRPPSLSDPLSQPGRGLGQCRPGLAGSRGKSWMLRVAARVARNYSPCHAGNFRRGEHRLYLGVYRIGRSSDV